MTLNTSQTAGAAGGGAVASRHALSVVVPCHRSGRALDGLVDAVLAQRARLVEAARAADGGAQGDLELVLVHDGSGPETWARLEALARRHPELRCFDLERGVGQVQATLCGLAQARGAVVVTMDDDLQHPPDQVPLLLARLAEDPALDCVFGRYERRRASPWRRCGSALVGAVLRSLYASPRSVRATSFRAMRRGLVERLVAQRSRVPLLGARILRLTRRVADVEVRHDARGEGRSGYGLGRQLRLFSTLVVARFLPGGPAPAWRIRSSGGGS